MYRPEIKQENFEQLNKLSNEVSIAANELVNMFVKIGIEALNRTASEMKKDFDIKVNTLHLNESAKSKSN